MGLARGAITLLVRENRQFPFSGRIGTLGRQTLRIGPEKLRALMAAEGLEPGAIDERTEVDDSWLFRTLGFDAFESIDYSDYEGATHIFDLNEPTLPDELKDRYDVVLDSGTLEHIFHVPNALRHMVEMTKVGGRIVLQVPSSNHIDHGFYMFSPTLFFDYFSANKFEIERMYVIRYSPDPEVSWKVYDYQPRQWDDMQCGGLDGNPYLNFVVVRKSAQSTAGVVPQQGFYASTSPQFAGSHLAGAAAVAPSNPQTADSPRKHAIRSALEAIPGGMRLARGLLRLFRKTLLNRKLVARV